MNKYLQQQYGYFLRNLRNAKLYLATCGKRPQTVFLNNAKVKQSIASWEKYTV